MIAIIVGAVTACIAACIAAAAALLPLRWPVQAWIAIAALIDAVALHGVFKQRSWVCGRIVGRGRPSPPAVALTFDDGPVEPYTSQILDVLRTFDARATFFVLGARVMTASDAVRRAVQEGHEMTRRAEAPPALQRHGVACSR